MLRLTNLPALAAVSIVCLSSCAQEPASPDYPHYVIAVELDPAGHSLDASVDLHFVSPHPDLQTASFLLHREMGVTAVRGERVSGSEFDRAADLGIPWIPAGGRLVVSFDEPLDENESTSLHFEYGGVIDSWHPFSANTISEEWTELGLYTPWFPYNYEDYGPFTYEVDVTIDGAYEVRGLGEAYRTPSGWQIESERALNDIVLMASQDLKTIRVETDAYMVETHYTSLTDSIAARLAEDVASVLSVYSDWYGATSERILSLVETKRDMGGGYARPGLIVLSNIAERATPEHRADLVRYFAHEAAHFWWSLAPTASWEDWLNESFAEYSALLILRDSVGDEAFQNRIARKKQESEDAPAIWGFDRSDNATAQNVLYNAGPVLLHELAARISDERFLEWCRELLRREVNSTELALQVLRTLEGDDAADWLEAQLR